MFPLYDIQRTEKWKVLKSSPVLLAILLISNILEFQSTGNSAVPFVSYTDLHIYPFMCVSFLSLFSSMCKTLVFNRFMLPSQFPWCLTS